MLCAGIIVVVLEALMLRLSFYLKKPSCGVNMNTEKLSNLAMNDNGFIFDPESVVDVIIIPRFFAMF